MNKQLNFAVCDDDEIVCEAICEKISKTVTSCGISVSLLINTFRRCPY